MRVGGAAAAAAGGAQALAGAAAGEAALAGVVALDGAEEVAARERLALAGAALETRRVVAAGALLRLRRRGELRLAPTAALPLQQVVVRLARRARGRGGQRSHAALDQRLDLPLETRGARRHRRPAHRREARLQQQLATLPRML